MTFREVVDDLTNGCGCACHTGIGYNAACQHCMPPPVARKPKRFFWRWSDGEYVYTGMYLWRGYFGGVVRLYGSSGSDILHAVLAAPSPSEESGE